MRSTITTLRAPKCLCHTAQCSLGLSRVESLKVLGARVPGL